MPSVAEMFEAMAWGPAPEAAEPALAWLDQHGRGFGHFIGGPWRAAQQTLEEFNPAHRRALPRVTQPPPPDPPLPLQPPHPTLPAPPATPLPPHACGHGPKAQPTRRGLATPRQRQADS